MFIKNLQQLETYLISTLERSGEQINHEELLPMETYLYYLSKLELDKINNFTWKVRTNPEYLHEDKFMKFISENNQIIQVYLPKWLEQSTTSEFKQHLSSVTNIPGVYSFWTSKNTPLYVGVSVNLGSRIQQSYKERFERYGKPIYLRTITAISYADACVLEVYYINKLHPALNGTSNAGDEFTIEINYPVQWCDPIRCNKVKNSHE